MIDFINKTTLSLNLRFFLYKNSKGEMRVQYRPSEKGLLKKGHEEKTVACLVGLPKTGHSTAREKLKGMSPEWKMDVPSPSEMFIYASDHHLFGGAVPLSSERGIEKMQEWFHKTEFEKAKRTMECVLEKHSLTHDDVLYFSFVRNPFDQAYSAWREAQYTHSCQLDFQDFIEKSIDFYTNKKKPKDIREASQLWHLRPQYENLLDEDNKVGVDFVFKFEKIEEDFKALFNIIKKRPQNDDSLLIHRNKRPDSEERRNGSSLRFYNEKTEALIREFYRQDFLYFCY